MLKVSGVSGYIGLSGVGISGVSGVSGLWSVRSVSGVDLRGNTTDLRLVYRLSNFDDKGYPKK